MLGNCVCTRLREAIMLFFPCWQTFCANKALTTNRQALLNYPKFCSASIGSRVTCMFYFLHTSPGSPPPSPANSELRTLNTRAPHFYSHLLLSSIYTGICNLFLIASTNFSCNVKTFQSQNAITIFIDNLFYTKWIENNDCHLASTTTLMTRGALLFGSQHSHVN